MGAITAASQTIRPVAPQQAFTAATEAPAAPTLEGDRFVRQGAPTLDLPGVEAGKTYDIKGNYQGHGFGGKSTINTLNDKTLDFTVNASAMMGLIKVKVHLRMEANPDGTVSFLGERVKGNDDKVDPNAPEKAGAKLKVVTNKPGLMVLQAPDGNQVSVASQPGGGLKIAYDQYQIALKP